ncbi:MAG: carbohydrate-binding domain-containing protein, partial [Fibromonadales bacterium]|nr:carbohydrate-binding domain-containing protein [Fibromonadales bacterium]
IKIKESANDGIHANDAIYIRGGVLDITSRGDAIQNENLPIHISGGKITAETSGAKSNGIYSAGPTKISNNPEINIITRGDGAKGIKSRGILSIEGGATDIKTYGAEHIDTGVSPPDSNSATGIKAHDDMEIKGGTLKVESWGSKIKGMSIDGNFEMSAGNLNIRANDDGMKVHGNLLISGGTVNISSERRDGIDCNKDITITGGSVTLTVGQNRQGINCSGKENITPGIVKNSGF